MTVSDSNEKPSGAIALVIAGVWLLGGSVYQFATGKWFPLFPIQIDGIFGIFESLIGRDAGLYASSFIAGLLGLAAFWLGSAWVKRQRHG